jgi:hypothetical protein
MTKSQTAKPTRAKPAVGKKEASRSKEIAKLKASITKKTIRVKTGAVGRPTDYREEYAEIAYRLALLGFIDTQLAEFFEISIPTLHLWRKKHPEFSKSTRLGKIIADAKVANSLYHRAIGMTVTETHKSTSEEKQRDSISETVVTKELPPDVNAAKFWLKNRQPQLWRENFGVTDGNGGSFGIVINEFLKPKEM